MTFFKNLLGRLIPEPQNTEPFPPEPAAGMTDTGKVRANNQDAYWMDIGRGLFVVADGLGGHNAGEVASQAALDALNDFLQAEAFDRNTMPEADICLQIQKGFRAAHDKVGRLSAENPDFRGMGCTMVAAVIAPGRLVVCHVGDCRAYLIRERGISLLTTDHSVVMELVKNGEMTLEQARHSPLKNQVTQAVGLPMELDPACSVHPLTGGERVLLCSDGLWDMLSDEEILACAAGPRPVGEACAMLVEQANDAGGKDNISVILMDYDLLASEAGMNRLEEEHVKD